MSAICTIGGLVTLAVTTFEVALKFVYAISHNRRVSALTIKNRFTFYPDVHLLFPMVLIARSFGFSSFLSLGKRKLLDEYYKLNKQCTKLVTASEMLRKEEPEGHLAIVI